MMIFKTKMEKIIYQKFKIKLWNQLVDDVFNHPKTKYSLFVSELIKRIIFTGNPLGRVSKNILKKLKEIN